MFKGFRFRTKKELDEILEANKGREIYATPEGFLDVIGGIKIFDVKDADGNPTGEKEIYIKGGK